MSILIKGMEMPTGERPVHIEIHRDGTVLQWKFGESDEIIGTAVEVPPHGDLIDRDELKENGELVNENIGLYSFQGISMESINNARTIIKAEQ